MKKAVFAIVMCTLGLHSQSKLLPNIGGSFKLEQTLKNNLLSLKDSEHTINQVLLYNKETFERTAYQNDSNTININLDEIKSGLHTAMVYVNGDIVVFNVDIKPTNLSENNDETDFALKTKEKIVKHYHVISTTYYKYNVSEFNVFSEKRKNELIERNIYDLTTRSGKKNKLLIHAVYADYSEAVIYETVTPKKI